MQHTLGIDVSKDRLDAHARPTGEARSFANDRAGLARLARWIVALGGPLAVFEATGILPPAARAGARRPRHGLLPG
jgi:transposase